jgi:hypothetical protein
MIITEMWGPSSPDSKPMLSCQIHIPLYHISFDGTLNGSWQPRNPDGFSDRDSQFSEPDMPRISVAPTIPQCFQAIYPNVSQFFEEENYPNIEFYVYEPRFIGYERVLPPKYLTNQRMVHDAHMTDEYCILDPTFMQLVGKVMIQNTQMGPFLQYNPFNNVDNKKEFFAPSIIDFAWIN